MFVGRETEISKLNAFYEGTGKVAAVYGHPGMGKTALLQEFSRELNPVFFTAYETCDVQELELLAKAMGVETAGAAPQEEKLSLEALLDVITQRAMTEKVLLIIDQYPAFAKADPGYEKVLHDYMKNQWKELPVKLILCGDSYLYMTGHVCGAKAVWQDMLETTIELTGMQFYEARPFLKELELEAALMVYGMCGGIPALLQQAQADVEQTLEHIFLSGAYDRYLPEQVMAGELRELSYYNRLLTCLAKGYNRVNQLSEMIGKPKDVVVPYLNTLMSIGVVTKDTPITELTNRKKTRYRIVNSCYAFWYGAIIPVIDSYYRGDKDSVLTEGVAAYQNTFMQKELVALTREYLWLSSGRQELPFTIEQMGNWWVNDEENKTTEGFDLVALGTSQGKTATVFVQCCYDDTPVEISYLKGLIEKTKQVRRDGDVFYVISAKGGYHENTLTVASAIKNIILLDAADLEKTAKS